MATILGITGTLGAGKGTVVEYLAKKGFIHHSVRSYLIEEIQRRGLPVNRDSMNLVGEGLRAEHGASFILEELYAKASAVGGNAIIESIRTVGEVESLKKKGMTLIAVDADPHVRYERAVKRGSETDSVSFEKFMADEEREAQGENPARMNIRHCIARADFIIHNDGTPEDLYAQVDDILAKL